MSVSRDHVLPGSQACLPMRTAESFSSRRLAFFAQTGVKESVRSRGALLGRAANDVLKDAGFAPNKLTEAREDATLLDHFARLAIELGRLPVYSELRLKKRTDPSFPNDKTFSRLGKKSQLLLRLYEHCATRFRIRGSDAFDSGRT